MFACKCLLYVISNTDASHVHNVFQLETDV